MTCFTTVSRDRRSTCLQAYLDDIHDNLLSADEERRLAEAIARGDREARARMIRANLRLVVRIARDYMGRGLGLDDLVGEGNLGLIRATEEYDPRFGTRFSTYASYWIKQAIRQALNSTTATIRLPAHMVNLLNRWRRAERELQRRQGGPPSHEQIADELGLSEGQRVLIECALRASRLGIGGWSSQDEPSQAEEVPDASEPPESALIEDERKHDLQCRLARLDDRERMILTLRFGLDGRPPMTLKEIGKRLGVTREWVRKIEIRAVQKLEDGSAAAAPPRRLQTAG
jgi:RNA polymerase primary sigma factor